METDRASSVLIIDRLAPEAYQDLGQVEEGYIPDPANSIVVVARKGEQIVGRTMLLRPFHIEGTWVAEHLRGGVTGIRLLKRLEFEAKNQGIQKLIAYAMEPKIEDYLSRMGFTQSRLTVWEKGI